MASKGSNKSESGAPTVTSLVACNVYISEGRSASVVSDLLEFSLKYIDDLKSATRVVHVFRDSKYNRSSFHFVGPAFSIASVVAPFCVKAWSTLESRSRKSRDISDVSSVFHLSSTTDHPAVGYVDHVAVLPLTESNSANILGTKTAATEIGGYLETQLGSTNVLYYGLASPANMTLATVRRNFTNFFQPSAARQAPVVTVGAPGAFVENYNVRLQCERGIARTLTRRLRETLEIEALTLAYDDDNIFEVACNISANVGTSNKEIANEVIAWSREHAEAKILHQYRVGTSVQQCLVVWEAGDLEYKQHVHFLREMTKDLES